MFSVKFISATTGFVTGTAGNILKTTNGGISWIYQGIGGNNTLRSVCFANASIGYVCGGAGTILKTTTGGVSTVGILENAAQNDFTIAPNPLSLQTTVSFAEEQKNTCLLITDVLGNEVKRQLATGKSATLDMTGFAKGIYFVKIVEDGLAASPTHVANRKIVVQ